MLHLIVPLAVVALAAAQTTYNGHSLGTFCANRECDIRGDVFLVDANTVQILRLHVKPAPGKKLKFVVANAAASTVIDSWSTIQPGGEWRKAVVGGTLDAGVNGETLVVRLPGQLADWKHFGIISDEEWDFKAAVALGNGAWYSVAASRVDVLDSRTLRLVDFSFEGSKPPDGWLYAGNGEVTKPNGENAMIVGRDTKSKHCPIRRDIRKETMTIELAPGQTIYSIDWLSVYCYDVGVDFGHMNTDLTPRRSPVPAWLPPLRSEAPKRQRKQAC